MDTGGSLSYHQGSAPDPVPAKLNIILKDIQLWGVWVTNLLTKISATETESWTQSFPQFAFQSDLSISRNHNFLRDKC
jgi:hypothetical protein